MQPTRRLLGLGWRIWLGIIAAWALAACTTITLVPAYDEQIDAGVTSLYADTSAFVSRMIQTAGTPAGAYDANAAFYEDAIGRVDALTARAEAHRALADCPSTKLLDRAFAQVRLPADVRGQIGTLDKDDCQVTLLRLIGANYADMRDVHRLRGAKGLPPEAQGQFIDGGVGAQLRAAIAVEVAKRGK